MVEDSLCFINRKAFISYGAFNVAFVIGETFKNSYCFGSIKNKHIISENTVKVFNDDAKCFDKSLTRMHQKE